MLAILLPRLAMVAVNRGAGSVTIGSGLELGECYGRYAFALVRAREQDEKMRALTGFSGFTYPVRERVSRRI